MTKPGGQAGKSGRGGVTTRATVHDVARVAEVSPMTVSRVLNGGTNVRAETRRRVERAMRSLDYRRNENARSLRPGQRTGLVGVIVTNIGNPYYAEVLLGIDDVLGKSGRRQVVGMSHGHADQEAALVRDFVGRQVEGLVVVPAGGSSEHLQPAARRELPLVLASRSAPHLEADTVLIDDLSGAEVGTARLLADGHRRIAFIGNAPTVSTAQRRYEGYQAALEGAGVPLDPALVHRDAYDVATAAHVVRGLLELDDPPTAVFSSNNRLTVGALQVLLPMHRQMPGARAIPVLAFDDFELMPFIDYPLTIIDHDARALGQAAARMLLHRLDDPQPGSPPLLVTLPTTVLPGNG